MPYCVQPPRKTTLTNLARFVAPGFSSPPPAAGHSSPRTSARRPGTCAPPSTDQQLDHHLPLFNLPPKILCNVVNVEIRGIQAGTDSNEVYAQRMLQPEADLSTLWWILSS